MAILLRNIVPSKLRVHFSSQNHILTPYYHRKIIPINYCISHLFSTSVTSTSSHLFPSNHRQLALKFKNSKSQHLFLSLLLVRSSSQMDSSKNEDEPTPQPSKILEPPVHKGMKIMDTAAFDKTVTFPSVTIPSDFNSLQIQDTIKALKPYTPRLIHFKAIQDLTLEGSSTITRRILLDPDKVTLKDLKSFLEGLTLPPALVESASSSEITLTYDNWKLDQIMNAIFPEELEKPSGWSIIGHIIHLNLRDHLLPFKSIIGRIILDKIPQAKTIVNKTTTLEGSTYRNFQMEVIAGVEDFIVQVKENYCTFKMDFSQVYWNPRLSTEHERIIKDWIKPGDVLYDVCAGVGPFAIPAGKKKCHTLANDLNPECAKWLAQNVTINKVGSFVVVFNKDGHDFIREDLPKDLKARLDDSTSFDPKLNTAHVTMNLPELAVKFLPSFWSILDPGIDPSLRLIVHVYCFIKDVEGFREKAIRLVNEHLEYVLSDEELLQTTYIRDVAPNKQMWRVTFRMPRGILTGEAGEMRGVGDEKPLINEGAKRPKLECSN